MNYFIVCEFDTKLVTKFNYLVGWDAIIEESDWSSNPISQISTDLDSYLDSILERVKSFEWPEPYFFTSSEKAKKVIDIIRSYDIPSEVSNCHYYLVDTKIRVVPKQIIKVTEL
jgi:hypothetical protein